MDTAQNLIQKPISILRSSTISDAIKKILENNVSRLIVKDSGKSVGIITEKDIGFFLFNEKTPLGLDSIPLEKIMKSIEYVKGSESVNNCAKIMIDKKISSLSVGNENSLEGIFTHIKKRMRVHGGLRIHQKQLMIEEFLRGN